MRQAAPCLGLFLVSLASGQSPYANGDGFSKQEWAIILTLSPLPALPVDTTNKYRDSPAAALLGQKLFGSSEKIVGGLGLGELTK